MRLKNKITRKQRTNRLMISFGLLGLLLCLSIWGIQYIQSQDRLGDAPATLRHSFMLNEKLWRILRSHKRQSPVSSMPQKGKNPRVNGSLGLNSSLDLSQYQVQVVQDKKVMNLSVDAIKLLPKTSTMTEFRCIEGWSEDISYSGTKFSDFMVFYDLGKKSDGTYYSYVGFETPDGEYYVSIDMESMLHDQTLLTYEMNEIPLSVENGAPIRLIIPIKYGIKSLKRIGKIIFADKKPRDYWAENGYDWYSGL